MTFYSNKKDEVLKYLRTSENGLNADQVDAMRKLYGKNTFESAKKQSLISKFFAQFKDLMVIVLIISAFLSIGIAVATKEYQNLFEGGIILFIVLLNATMGVVQENKADSALEQLKNQTLPYSECLRSGETISVKTQDLVVGDVVLLQSGNIVPADVRLIETHNFKVNESALTGESFEIEKDANVVLDEHTPLGERKNMAYKGSIVTKGRAIAVVTSVGKSTEMGKIASMIMSGKKDLTPLQKSLNRIGKIISISVIIIAIVIFAVEMIVPANPKILESFLTAVALAVAAIPESLPASITIIMALGVQKLASKNAIIKRLHAVETLGSCSVICSDKTGTLTQNKMTVKEIFTLSKVFVNASNEDKLGKQFKEIINCMVFCNDSKMVNGKICGEPTETALFSYVSQSGYDINEIVSHKKRIYEIPFDSSRKIMSTINASNGEIVCYTKGALDYLIKKCSKVFVNGKCENISQTYLSQIEKQNEQMTKSALRVLCLAFKPIENMSQIDKLVKPDDIESNLIFLGLVGMFDPPRKEAKEAIKKCFTAGIKPVMITGDHAGTALAIAKEIGLAKSEQELITGDKLSKMTDKQLISVVHKYSVFARVTPEHKVRIVNAFKLNGKIVAMTGDGVNDAPSLKNADIGIGMGISGTDVTKDVADMIISDDNFATIIIAVKEGRKIYSNIQRTIQFLLSTNAVEVFTLFIASLFLPNFTFLLPSQLLFINFITDSLPAISLGLEPCEKEIMSRPPREANQNIITLGVWGKILYQAAIQIVIVMCLYCTGLNMYGEKVASTLVFYCINIMQLLHAVNLKTSQSIFRTNIFKNKLFNVSFAVAMALIVLVAVVPALTSAFGLVSLSMTQWGMIIFSSVLIIPIVEVAKFLNKKFNAERIK